MATVAVAAVFFVLGGAGGDDNGPERGINERHQRPGRPGRGRARAGRGPAPARLGLRGLRACLLRPDPRDRHDRLPLRAAHRRGRAGGGRPRPLRRPAGSILWVLFSGGVRSSAARSAVAACFVAMIVHSLGYAGFIIDPATWALLALGVALHPGREARTAGGVAPGGVPAPTRDHRRRLHGVERRLEADRGLPAADLHGLPDPQRLRRRRGDAGLGDRGHRSSSASA